MRNQHTSSIVNPVGSGLAKHLGRMVEDAMPDYPGGTAKAELAKGHPGFSDELYELIDSLAVEQALRLPLMQRPTWKVLNRTCSNAKGYTADLKAGGFQKIGDWANHIMKKHGFKKGFDVTSVELGSATGKELTGSDEPTTAKIHDAIRRVGGELCPAWVGPELRKQYPDQPNGEVLIIAMETIADSGGYPRVFSVGHDGSGRWLSTRWDYPAYRWLGNDRWVFLRRK